MGRRKFAHGGARAGAGRPPVAGETLRRRPVGLLPDQWDYLRAVADRESVSVDEVLRRLVALDMGVSVRLPGL